MRKSRFLMMATVLALFSVLLPMPAAADTAKIGDLSKSGYTCKDTGETTSVCTRGKTDPVYGCEQGDCKTIPRSTKSTRSLIKPLSKGDGIGKITTVPADVQ